MSIETHGCRAKVVINNILDHCEIKPMVNQVLCHISNTPKELLSFCESHGILVESYAPIAHGKMLKNKEVMSIADKYGVSVSQLAVDFEISEADMTALKKITPIKGYGLLKVMPVFFFRSAQTCNKLEDVKSFLENHQLPDSVSYQFDKK